IDVFTDNGYTQEEMKMINETKKIMEKNELPVEEKRVRQQVFTSHAESVDREAEKYGIAAEELKEKIKRVRDSELERDIIKEMKMNKETKKIMEKNDLPVAATCVRLPVFTSHAESVYIEVEKDGVSAEELKETLKNGKGIVLEDDITTQTYPTPLSAENKKE